MMRISYFVRQRRIGGLLQFILVPRNKSRVNLNFWRRKSWCRDELQALVPVRDVASVRPNVDDLPYQLPCQPKEGLLEVILLNMSSRICGVGCTNV